MVIIAASCLTAQFQVSLFRSEQMVLMLKQGAVAATELYYFINTRK